MAQEIGKQSKLDEVVARLGGENSKSGRVLVAMSGGVDSSVVVAIIHKLGYEGIGVHLQFWVDDTFNLEDKDKFPENKCCSLESLEHAREIAGKYNMPFYVLNSREVFKKKVVDYFINEFEEGVIPNPCIECNRFIKFGFLIDKMNEFKADYIATGHYAKVEEKNNVYYLQMADDRIKDQSYFLYTLNQEKLKHCLFPIADLTKNEVRQIAKEEGLLKVASKKDSTGVCFFPEKSHVPFLKRHMKKGSYLHGNMITKTGEIKGEHIGLPMYTIGQREGLEIGGAGGPWYVIDKNTDQNTLIVGPNEDLYSKEILANNLSFTNEIPVGKVEIQAKIRHRFEPESAVLEVFDTSNSAKIIFEKPQRAVTKGQSIVFYNNETVIGGGIIQ